MPRRIQRHRPARPNGFTTIMILMLLVLILILVLTYLRTMRAYTITHPILQPSADVVLVRLQSDLAGIIGEDGKIDAHEPHDYPWTCARMNAPCALSYPEMVSSTQGLGDPKVDDAWLAPNEPEGNQWKQVSNIYNSFLAYDHANLSNIPMNTATQAWVPSDVPAGATIQGMANAAQSGLPPTSPASTSLAAQFQNVPLNDPRLVDADGDGVPDSLWFYPKDNLQGGLRYVAAVRVVDLCGCLNINTALGEFGAAPGTVGGDIPKKGEGPYEIDASPLLGAMPAASQTFRNASGDAYGRWLANGAKTANSGQPYGDDGVGTKVNTATTAPVTRTGIRYDLNDELQLKDFSNRITAAFAPQPVLGAHYPALTLTQANPPRPPVTDYAALAADLKLRQRTTTLSGTFDRVAGLPLKTAVANYSTNLRAGDVSLSQAAEGRALLNGGGVDVRLLGRQSDSTGVTSLVFAGIQTGDTHNTSAVAGLNSLNGEYPYPMAFQKITPAGSAIHILQQRQLNACWADALDRDNAVTVDGGHWMGWEPLPILTEFYAQMPYFVCGNAAGYNYAPTPSGPNYSVVYINTTQDRNGGVGMRYNQPAHEAGLGSYAFEVANPYDIPIRLTHVRFVFNTQSMPINAAPTPSSSFDVAHGAPLSTSKPLDAYVNAAPPPGMAKDAEGHFVLKPGEKIVFYRNGTGGEPAPSSPSVGAKSDISGLIDTSDGKTYKVDLGTAISGDTAAPDINGHVGSRNFEHFSLQCLGQNTNGTLGTNWYHYNWMSYNSMPTGYTAYPDRCLNAERNVPAGRQGAPGDLVYHQVDVRTFGVDQKLDLLQVRPPVIKGNSAPDDVIDDWGDMEYRSNLYANVGSGLYGSTLPGRYPPRDTTANLWFHTNPITAAHMPLNPNWMAYDTTLSTLGKSKISFPGPNGGHAMYATGRQSIQNEKLWFNYVGIPDDAAYPGTFPELTVVGSPMDQRNNGTAAGGASRADGVPRVLDLLRAPFVGPRIGGSYRGGDSLINHALRNTIGDAVNYFLARDTHSQGVKNLRLRTDIPWFDTSSAAAVAQYAPALTYNAATNYAANQEAWHAGEIYQAQAAGAQPAPDPAPDTGNVGSGKAWKLSNGPYARASQCWQHSFAEVLLSRFQVDSPKYKGQTAANGADFKPGTVNLNTAPKEVLMCLSAPAGRLSAADADRIIANRKAPASGVSAAGGARKGFTLASEAFGPLAALDDADFDTLSWLPQQATCRSDTFCAYIIVQGYKADDFNKGPVDVRRAVVLYSRDTSGGSAKILSTSVVPGK